MNAATHPAAAAPKGYWIVRVSVTDAGRYPAYLDSARPAFEKYGARFVVRGGACEPREGSHRERNVVVEFADMATARACYESPEYRRARAIRHASAVADFVIVEGAGNQPPAAAVHAVRRWPSTPGPRRAP